MLLRRQKTTTTKNKILTAIKADPSAKLRFSQEDINNNDKGVDPATVCDCAGWQAKRQKNKGRYFDGVYPERSHRTQHDNDWPLTLPSPARGEGKDNKSKCKMDPRLRHSGMTKKATANDETAITNQRQGHTPHPGLRPDFSRKGRRNDKDNGRKEKVSIKIKNGRRGIWTPDRISPILVFKTSAINHSAILPFNKTISYLQDTSFCKKS